LAEYGEGFRVELERLGYTPLTAAMQVRLVAHLSRWMVARDLTVSSLTPATVNAYFADRRAAGYFNEVSPRALCPLLTFLRGLGVLAPPEPEAATSPAEVLLERYRDYLTVQRGLAATTVDLNVRLVRPLLTQRAEARAGRLELEDLTAVEVSAFVVAQSRERPRSVKRIVTALRSLLGFLHVDGVIAVPLAASVPSPAGWTLAGIPQALDVDQVAALIVSCDRDTATGLRDAAILTLMARLGLRAGEVAALRLDDVDWRRGEITMRGKGNRHDRLPLPADVGEFLVDYLRNGRPSGALDRTVFIRAQAPYRSLASGGVIHVVVVAGRRTDIGVIGAHRLRHSAATAMLAGGSSMAEIGQVLRHNRPSTTTIYAKVDLQALQALTRTWPDQGWA
jgi:site-specific recombinase XerD